MNQSQIVIPTPFDAHVHLRDGEALATTVPHIASRFGYGIVMPNLKPAVRKVEEALAYRERILVHVPEGSPFVPLMTLYLTEATYNDDLLAVANSEGAVVACKLYPAGATTNSQDGIPNVNLAFGIFEVMERLGIPLCVHGEVTDPDVDVFDREKAFIDQYLRKINETFPNLRIVMEHVTTKEAVEFVESCGDNVAASITAHHLLFNRNAIFQGGLQPHWYCLPVLKRGIHQEALVRAATSGNAKFFAGTDSAPHPQGLKEAPCGCAGCYTAPQSAEMYARAFDLAGVFDLGEEGVDRFVRFMSLNGPRFYGIPQAGGRLVLTKGEPSKVPAAYPFDERGPVVPLLAGQPLEWKAERIVEEN